MASATKFVLRCVIFVVFLAMTVLPSVPFLPVGRTTGTLLSAAMMVIFKVLTPDEAFAAIDLSVLALLFGMMLVCAFLERADFFKHVEYLLSWRCQGGRDLLCRVCLLAGVISSLLTNDATCVLLTSFVLDLCKRQNLPPQPFLMALATSSNIGSAATPIGNPQNVIIALQGNISFGKFLAGIIAPVVVGLVVNTVLLLLLYWRKLRCSAIPDCPISDSTRAEGNGADTPQVTLSIDGNFAAGGGQVDSAALATSRLEDGCQGADKLPTDEGMLTSMCPTEADDNRGLELAEVPDVRYRAGCLSEGSGQSGGKQGIEGSDDLHERRCWSLSDTGDKNETEGGYRRETSADSADLKRRRGSRRRSCEEGACEGFSGRHCSDCGTGSEETILNDARVWGRLLTTRRDTFLSIGVYCVTLGMLVCFLLGLNLPWVAVSAAIIMLCLDFRDGQAMLDKISYSLLVFFVGMFISVQGFNATELPRKLWDAVSAHATLSTVSGTAVLSAIILVLSNVASNVPTVLLLGPLLAASAANTPGVSVTRAWLVLAWVSTVAGNFTLLGSAANLIVSEQAIRAANNSYRLSLWNHLRFGIPSTILVIAVGLPLVQS